MLFSTVSPYCLLYILMLSKISATSDMRQISADSFSSLPQDQFQVLQEHTQKTMQKNIPFIFTSGKRY